MKALRLKFFCLCSSMGIRSPSSVDFCIRIVAYPSMEVLCYTQSSAIDWKSSKKVEVSHKIFFDLLKASIYVLLC